MNQTNLKAELGWVFKREENQAKLFGDKKALGASSSKKKWQVWEVYYYAGLLQLQ